MSNVDTHRAIMNAFSRRDWDEAVRAVREDCLYTDHPRNLSVKGPREMADWLQGWTQAFPDAKPVDTHIIDGGEYTVALFHAQGTNDGPLGSLPATGKRMDVPFCEVLRYDSEGHIVAGEAFYDVTTLMVQLGHMPPLPT
ncbi:ester cyclase [Actinomycetes bacterium KLBMP 9797]